MNFNLTKYFITFLFLIFSIKSQAAHWFTYYIYFETEYIQGPWSKTHLLNQSNYKYLTVEKHNQLLGTEDEDLVETLISTLREIKPDLYNWEYDLKINKNTVEITASQIVENIETVKNELIATILFNNFETLKFNYNGKSEILTLNDLTLPYFDLVNVQNNEKKSVEEKNNLKENVEVEIEKNANTNSLIYWLIASILLNLGFVVYLFQVNK